MPTNKNEPATWFAEPGAAGMRFDLLELAVAHALAISPNERHLGAKNVAKSGATYGWDAINVIALLFR
jgi:hypothetical protein